MQRDPVAMARSSLELHVCQWLPGEEGALWEPVSLHVPHIFGGDLRRGKPGEKPWKTLKGQRTTSLLLYKGKLRLKQTEWRPCHTSSGCQS